MRWPKKNEIEPGTQRINQGFLFLPIRLVEETRWWEYCFWVEIYTGSYWKRIRWFNFVEMAKKKYEHFKSDDELTPYDTRVNYGFCLIPRRINGKDYWLKFVICQERYVQFWGWHWTFNQFINIPKTPEEQF